jgi:hypothetical protein
MANVVAPTIGNVESDTVLRFCTASDAPSIHKLLCVSFGVLAANKQIPPDSLTTLFPAPLQRSYSNPLLLAHPVQWERISLAGVREKMQCGQFLVGVEHDGRVNSDSSGGALLKDAADYFALGVCVFIDTTRSGHLAEMNCLAVRRATA